MMIQQQYYHSYHHVATATTHWLAGGASRGRRAAVDEWLRRQEWGGAGTGCTGSRTWLAGGTVVVLRLVRYCLASPAY